MVPDNQIELFDELNRCSQILENEINGISRDICGKYPISDYIKDIKSHFQFRTHSYFGYRRKKIFTKITNQHGSTAIATYHKLALAGLMKYSLEHLKKEPLPEKVNMELHTWYRRIMNDFKKQADEYYHHYNTDFIYDVGVCCLKSLPVGGAWFVQVRRIGLRFFTSKSIIQFIKKLWYLFIKMRGYNRYCVIHTYNRFLPRFNEQQLNYAYRNISELLKHNPKIRGIYRRSWFLDPELGEISPRLSYLRKIPQQNGAVFFETSTTNDDIRDAIRLSPLRKELYKEGKYIPKVYAFIWNRKDFLNCLNEDETI